MAPNPISAQTLFCHSFVFPGIISFPRETPVASSVIFTKLYSASEGGKGNRSHPSPAWGGPAGSLRLELSTLGAASSSTLLPAPQTNGDTLSKSPRAPRAEARNVFSLPFGLRKANEPTRRNPKEMGMKNHQPPPQHSKPGHTGPCQVPNFPRINVIFYLQNGVFKVS